MSIEGSGSGCPMSESLESTASSSSPKLLEDSMFDSGFSSGSLSASCSASTNHQPGISNTMCSSSESSSVAHPVVQMPDLSALSLSECSPGAWREYYTPDEDGDVQLHLAIASGFAEVVYALIRMVPNPEFLNIQNNTHYAPLHIAVLQNQPSVVRRLVISGARLDVRDKEGNTPLHLAARRGLVQCGEALLKSISVEEMTVRCLPSLPVDIVDLRNASGEASVHLATMGGHSDFLLFLSWNNADVNALEGRSGRSALHFAVGARNLAIIHTLLEPRPRGCGMNPCLVDWYGRSAYQLAIANCVPDIAQCLASRSGMAIQENQAEDSSSCSSDEEILSRPILNSA